MMHSFDGLADDISTLLKNRGDRGDRGDKAKNTNPINAVSVTPQRAPLSPLQIEGCHPFQTRGDGKDELNQSLARGVTPVTPVTRHSEQGRVANIGCVPATEWHAILAALKERSNPDWMMPDRWEMLLLDAGRFLDRWSSTARAMGWTALDLFGVHPTRPTVRFDVMGLLLLLQGGDPRGIRNRNPLNLEASPFTQRQPGFTGSDGRFGQFGSMEQGLAAAGNLLQSYGQRGINTISGIINRWAPANDGNPVSAYAQFVARKAGVDPNAPIDMNDPAVRQRVVGAMAEFENGRPVQVASNDPAALPVNAQPTQGGGQPGLTAENIPMLLQARSNPNLPTSQREFADKLLTRWLDESKTPDKIKTLQQLKAASGYQGSILDLEKELKAAGAINIDQRAESGEAKAAGEAAGKRRADMFAAAGSAGKTLTNLSRMEGLLNQVSQGKLAPARMNVSAWAKAMGLNDQVAESIGLDPKGAGSAQALQSLINESVVGKIGPGGFPANNFSDADRAFITDIFAKLGNEPRANKIIIEGARRIARLDIERAKAFQAFKRDSANKGRGFEDFELDWADKMAKRDVFGGRCRVRAGALKRKAGRTRMATRCARSEECGGA